MQNIIDTAKVLYEGIRNTAPFRKHMNIILAGNNANGKSRMIKYILEQSLKEGQGDIYYIDSKNRVMTGGKIVQQATAKKIEDLSVQEIVQTRITSGIYTVKDRFTEQDSGGAVVFDAVYNNMDKYQKIYTESLGIFIEPDQKIINNGLGSVQTIRVNQKCDLSEIASSEAARMRILFEVEYAASQEVKAVIIDEFDAYFSEQTTIDFLKILVEKYPQIRFILVLHALYSIVNIEDFDVAVIIDRHDREVLNNDVEIYDGNNISSVEQVDKVSYSILGYHRITESLTPSIWEGIVANVVDGIALTEEHQRILKETDRNSLKAKDKILFDFIKRQEG